jgi:5-methylcytosine-specific restriction endonuclease McrA
VDDRRNGVVCGCSQKDRLKRLHEGNIKENIAFEYVLHDYQYSAKKRGYEFALTEEQFKELTQQNCFYCGIEPKRLKYKNGNHCFKRSKYIYNGIDRRDNSKGYIVENCVACCRVCNIAKSQMTVDEFILWIQRLAKKWVATS